MAKKMMLQGRVYLCKWLCRLIVMEGRAAFLKYKEGVLFDNAVVALGKADGTSQLFSTASHSRRFLCYYYDMDSNEDEIVFEDPDLNKEWSRFFLYMFSEDGAFLIYADREVLSKVGVRAVVGTGNHADGIMKEAYNVAALYPGVLKEITYIKENIQSQKEVSFLEVGRTEGAE